MWKAIMSGDIYKRRLISKDEYQCGCKWVRKDHGDVLILCIIHERHSKVMWKKYEKNNIP
jgi:hypothetical protein